MDARLLILRVVVGAALVGHGTQKLFGWFGGHGPVTTGAYFGGGNGEQVGLGEAA